MDIRFLEEEISNSIAEEFHLTFGEVFALSDLPSERKRDSHCQWKTNVEVKEENREAAASSVGLSGRPKEFWSTCSCK